MKADFSNLFIAFNNKPVGRISDLRVSEIETDEHGPFRWIELTSPDMVQTHCGSNVLIVEKGTTRVVHSFFVHALRIDPNEKFTLIRGKQHKRIT